MTITVSGTTLTFNDSTTMTTAATGTVTSVATGNGLTGGTITGSGTISLDFYTGSSGTNTSFPIGTYVLVGNTINATQASGASSPVMNNSRTTYISTGGTFGGSPYQFLWGSGSGVSVSALSGTWVRRGSSDMAYCCTLKINAPHLMQRIS